MTIFERPIFKEIAKALSDSRIIVITGMRRVGKTTAVRWLMDQISTNNKLFMDLERLDQRTVFEEQNYDLVLNYFRNQGLDLSKPMTIALDEIQYVPNLPSVIKYLYDHYGIKFILTGSSSFYLKNYFSESMAGRKIVYEMFPLSFGEFLSFRDVPYFRKQSFSEMLFDNHEYERLKAHYDEFIKYGGLPNVVLEPNPQVKREILNDIFSSYINIDVQTLADFRKIGELQRLLQILVIRMGNRIDYSKLSLIVGISRPTLNEYLEFLEKTYIIYQLPAYSSVDRSVALGKKLYFRDNGIASILAHPGEGALYENAIFNQLRNYGELAYLSKGKEFEIDFILNVENSEATALEVKYHPVETDEKKLKKIANKYKFNNYWIVGRYPTPGFEKFVWGGSIF
ncbi:MAG: ATP-binding protein [Anaerolineaceae bacterium]|nr:ATP-binding protein [Anaerolineaceae bacterium]